MVEARKIYLKSADTTNEGLCSHSLVDNDDGEVSTTTEILSNVALRVKNRFVDLVEGDNPEEDTQSISSSDVSSDGSMDNTDEPVKVTPLRPSSEEK